MKLREITDYLESIAPLHLQESYDNSGLLVGHPDQEITNAVISLDATPEVVQEAIDLGCNLVISHHPIVFGGLKRFNYDNYIQRAVMMAIKHDIALYAIHTNLDNVLDGGVNERIAHRLGLSDLQILQVKDAAAPTIGAGVVGQLTVPMATNDFFQHLKTSMNLEVIKHTAVVAQSVERVAVCGGSGSFLLNAAKASGAQVFITADYKYHQFFDADGDIIIVDIGHYESEQFTINLLYDQLTQKFRNFAPHCTKIITNPINYF